MNSETKPEGTGGEKIMVPSVLGGSIECVVIPKAEFEKLKQEAACWNESQKHKPLRELTDADHYAELLTPAGRFRIVSHDHAKTFISLFDIDRLNSVLQEAFSSTRKTSGNDPPRDPKTQSDHKDVPKARFDSYGEMASAWCITKYMPCSVVRTTPWNELAQVVLGFTPNWKPVWCAGEYADELENVDKQLRQKQQREPHPLKLVAVGNAGIVNDYNGGYCVMGKNVFGMRFSLEQCAHKDVAWRGINGTCRKCGRTVIA